MGAILVVADPLQRVSERGGEAACRRPVGLRAEFRIRADNDAQIGCAQSAMIRGNRELDAGDVDHLVEKRLDAARCTAADVVDSARGSALDQCDIRRRDIANVEKITLDAQISNGDTGGCAFTDLHELCGKIGDCKARILPGSDCIKRAPDHDVEAETAMLSEEDRFGGGFARRVGVIRIGCRGFANGEHVGRNVAVHLARAGENEARSLSRSRRVASERARDTRRTENVYIIGLDRRSDRFGNERLARQMNHSVDSGQIQWLGALDLCAATPYHLVTARFEERR